MGQDAHRPLAARGRILVVEDDEVIADRLRLALTKEGYRVDVARDGETGYFEAVMHSYSVIVLDVMMPVRDGWEVCAALRAERVTTPILMLTARDSVEDRVNGLDAGADDYLAKPFAFPEFMARIRALTRRAAEVKSAVVACADLQVDTSTRTVTRAGQVVKLTPREYSLLEALVRNAGRTLTREVIVESVWGDDDSLTNTVPFHVTSLRKKIDTGRDESLIETVHGFGYRIRDSREGS